jgi:hypothetical protein
MRAASTVLSRSTLLLAIMYFANPYHRCGIAALRELHRPVVIKPEGYAPARQDQIIGSVFCGNLNGRISAMAKKPQKKKNE